MRYRKFGSTGLEVSEVGIGTMRLSADAAHVPQQLRISGGEAEAVNKRAREVLEAALDAGINCFHSSEDYGTWWLLGGVLKSRAERNDVHHVIKVTSPDYEEDSFDPSMVRAGVERALVALHTERISFVQHLHRGPRVAPRDAYSSVGDGPRVARFIETQAIIRETFDGLKREGKVGAVVAFPHTVGFLEASWETEIYAGMVHFLNLIETEIVPSLPRLGERALGFFALRPLLQGMLSSDRLDRQSLDKSDPVSLPIWDSRYRVLDRILKSSERGSLTLSAFALRFALSFAEVSSVISSPRNSAQLQELLDASEADRFPSSVLSSIRNSSAEADSFSKYDLFPENQST